MTFRQQEIYTWLSSLLDHIDENALQEIQSDASQRKYLRLNMPDRPYVIMDTKPDQELLNFCSLAKILWSHTINAPEIINCNTAQGLLLLTDLGHNTYLTELKDASSSRVDSLYLDAIATLIKMQQINVNNMDYNLKHMDEEYISSKLEVFSTWYLQQHLGMELDNSILDVIKKLHSLFCAVFTEVPHVFVHVDYHCRNLMVTNANNPGVLDFQDAMCGPLTYDLVSLFQDAYITWPRLQVESWINVYQDMAVRAGIMQSIPAAALIRNFDLVGLQRHIKNLGVFARLHHRDQKSNYLNDMPTLLHYIHDTCTRYPELDWLFDFITEAVLE